MRISGVGQGSAAAETQPPETKPEVLQTIITHLEGEVELLSKLKQVYQQVRQEQETPCFHSKQEHPEFQQTVPGLKYYIPTLGKKICKIIEEGTAQTWNHFNMF